MWGLYVCFLGVKKDSSKNCARFPYFTLLLTGKISAESRPRSLKKVGHAVGGCVTYRIKLSHSWHISCKNSLQSTKRCHKFKYFKSILTCVMISIEQRTPCQPQNQTSIENFITCLNPKTIY